MLRVLRRVVVAFQGVPRHVRIYMQHAGDIREKMPRLLIGDFFADSIDPALSSAHAADLLAGGTLAGICQDDLAAALTRAQLLYIQGQNVTAQLKAQKSIAFEWKRAGRHLAAQVLRTQPKAHWPVHQQWLKA